MTPWDGSNAALLEIVSLASYHLKVTANSGATSWNTMQAWRHTDHKDSVRLHSRPSIRIMSNGLA